MSEDSVTVPIVCSECETTTRVPISELPDAVEAHNERLHEGRDVAEIDPEIRDRIADLAAQDVVFEDDEA